MLAPLDLSRPRRAVSIVGWRLTFRPKTTRAVSKFGPGSHEHPKPTPTQLVDAGLRRAALAAAVRTRRRSRAPAHHRRRDAARRRVAPGQPDRHRPLRADPRRARVRRAEGPVHLADAHRRGHVVPAVQRAGRRLRPRQPQHAGRARRRRLRRQRPEDLDVARRARQVRHPDRAHRHSTSRSTSASRTSSSR